MRLSTFKLSLTVFTLALLSVFLFMGKQQQQQTFKKLPKMQRIDKAIEQEFEATKDPALNEVPRQRLAAARTYADRLRNNPSQRAAISGISWDERGPNNVSGRTRAMLVDAGDATGNTLFAGGVGGGLWVTNNALAGTPTWTNIGDQFGNLAISCIDQDPSNNNTMYFGTGEGWFNADAIRGLGIWKSTNGGTTWSQLSSTNNSTFYYVQKIEVASNGDVYACTRDGGIQRSTNGGSSWTKVLGSGAGASTNRAADIEIAANGDFYASMGIFSTDGIYKSSNGTSWTKQAGGLPTSGYTRIELACAPSDQNRVYAVYCGTSYNVSGIYRTDNGGTSWTSLTVPSAFGMANYARGQAWYDLIAAVHPTNSSRVFIGGIDILVSSNAGSSWLQITQWYGGGGFQYAHADQHGMIFQPNNANVMYYANDGGVFRTTNSAATTPTISFISNGYNVTQYYHADIHPGYGVNEYLAGAQDNGTQRYTSPGINNTIEVTGGDGAFSHIDQDNPAIQISAYVYNQYRVTSNAWGSYTTVNYSSSTGRFINPTDYDSDENVLYGANNGNSYFRMTGVGSSNTTGAQSMTAFGGAEASHVKVSPNVTNRVYFGLDNGDVVRVDNAHNTSASGTVIRAGSGYVSCVEVEDGDEDHILVTYSNYGVNSIWETTNGGSTWTSVEGNLPDMPIRWVIFIPGQADSAMVATELGTWTTDNLNGTSTVWGASNTDFANVRVDALVSRSSDRQIIAATHGRGLFSTDFFNVPPPPVTCNATVTSFPYAESFETGVGDWQYATGQFQWTRNSGGTPSSGTGPTGASDGSFYMYMEVSSPNYPSLNAYFEGPCFDLTGASDSDISFQYHMLGAPGTLRLQVSTDNGASWPTDVWTISGDQGSNWQTANVDLSAYAGSIIKLRFHGTSGTTWQGDICVDDINVTTAGAAPLVVTIPTSSNVSCNGGNDGSATASATGGTAPYSYSWSSGANTATASGLSAGSYTVTVTDASSATATANITITEPSALSASATATDASCNGVADGSVDLTVSGGTAPYTYSWSNSATTQDLAAVAAGTYTVTVADANGCTTNAGATVSEPTALSASASATDASCNGASDGSVDLTVSGGTAPYTYSWSNSATTQDLAAVAAGTYTVTVADANGCTTNAGATVGEPSAISASATAIDASCNGVADGSVDLNVSGGTAPYTYTWSNSATTQDLSAVAAGTYTVIVADANGCTANAGATVNEPTALSTTATATNVTCNGAADGSIDLSVSGGTAPYNYTWSNAATTQNLTSVGPGTYTVTVVDANGCTAADGATVTEPAALSLSISGTDESAAGASDGAADLTVSGGTAPYSYNWSNGATTQDISGLSGGTYNVTVTDANNCSANESVVINTLASPLAIIISGSNDVSCNGGNDGDATAAASGGTPPYSYSWTSGATSATATGLSAGSYTVTVTDAALETASTSVNISEPTALSASASATNAACNGGNGSVDLTVSGGTAPYTYSWSNGATTEDLAAVVANTYNVTVTDANGCVANAGATVSEPTALSASTTATNAACNGGNGSVDLTVSGGTAPYSYSWSNGATTEDLAAVVANTYNVTVTDANGCVANASATVSEPATLIASAAATNAPCNGGNGSVDLTVSGGTAPYSYSWSNGATTEDLTAVVANTYNVTVTDANGCVANAGATVSEPATLTASASATDAACNGGNGSVDLTVTGGTAPYSYSWSNSATTQDLAAVAAGTYTVTVADANGCTTNAGATVSEPSALSASASATDAVCNGGNGSVALTVSGGTPPYSYTWSNGATTQNLAAVVAGTYSVTVEDANGCTAGAGANVNEPSSLSLSISGTDESAPAANDGAADLTVSGGTPPYSYSWSNGATTQDISGLAGGTYNVTVTDANGCTGNESVVINTINLPSIKAEYGIVSNVGDAWQTINLTQSYSSMVVVATPVLPNQNTLPVVSRVQNTSGSSFQLRIQNPGGTAATTYDVHYFVVEEGVYTQAADGLTMEAVKFTSTVTAENNNWAFEAHTYSNTYTNPVVLGQVMSYNDASWSVFWASENGNRVNPPIASSLAAGKNVGEDTDNTRSNETVGYVVFESGSGSVGGINFIAGVGADAVAGPTNTVGYNYTLSGLADASVAVLSTAAMDGRNGGWPVLFGASPVSATQLTMVFDEDQIGDSERAHTNEQVAYLVFENPTGPCANFAANVSASDISCNGLVDGSATASPVNGTAPFSYSWSNGGTTANISGLGASLYTVTITDANNCTAQAVATVNEPAALTASVVGTDVSCNAANDGAADLTVSGGTAPYSYSWSNGATTEDINGLAPGAYSVTVTDNEGCTAGANTSITEPTAITASASAIDASCNGYSDGSVDLTVGGGTAPYSYSWSNGATTEDITGLAAGNYTVTVTDANGCTEGASASVGEPAGMSLSTIVTDASCNGDTDGAVDLTVTGGINPLSFSWSNGATTEDISGVGAGNYSVDVIDGSGCMANTSANVGQPAALASSASVTDESTAGSNDGAIDLTVSGGTAPYSYSWTGPSGFTASTQDISSLAPGTYDVSVLDANGCSHLDSYTVAPGSFAPSITIEEGVATGVGSSWQTINTTNTYTNMVVVATPVITSNINTSIVTRIQNAGTNSFQLRVQDPSGSNVSGITVHYVVVEAGVYDQATYGVTMEAVRAPSTITSGKNNWVLETRSYSNTYTNPVVIGQVMTYNDANWSAFWATSSSRTKPPTATSFRAGKMVGEDPNNTRANEDIGYIVIESGSGSIGSLNYDAAVGSDIVRGLGNSSTGYNYSTATISNISSAHVSSAGMDGGDGGWPCLFGQTPVSTSQITLSFPEDVLRDTERNHTTEQVAYIVFGGTSTTNQPISGVTEENKDTDPIAPQTVEVEASFDLFPNPTNGRLFLVTEGVEAQSVEVKIFDMKGSEVWKKQFELIDGSQKLGVDLTALPSGMYILRLNSANLTYTNRFVKH